MPGAWIISPSPTDEADVVDRAGGVAEEDEVAGLQRGARGDPRAHGRLVGGVPRDGDAERPVDQLGEPGAVDAEARRAGPEVPEAGEAARLLHELRAGRPRPGRAGLVQHDRGAPHVGVRAVEQQHLDGLVGGRHHREARAAGDLEHAPGQLRRLVQPHRGPPDERHGVGRRRLHAGELPRGHPAGIAPAVPRCGLPGRGDVRPAARRAEQVDLGAVQRLRLEPADQPALLRGAHGADPGARVGRVGDGRRVHGARLAGAHPQGGHRDAHPARRRPGGLASRRDAGGVRLRRPASAATAATSPRAARAATRLIP